MPPDTSERRAGKHWVLLHIGVRLANLAVLTTCVAYLLWYPEANSGPASACCLVSVASTVLVSRYCAWEVEKIQQRHSHGGRDDP